jgi:hypothetical protein
MMSKERELLKKCLDFMLDAGANLNPLFKEVNDVLLAQPEQEQEPVAWMYEWDSTTTGQPTCKYVNMGKDKPNVEANFLVRNFIPLYTVPQNQDLREGISLRDHFAGLALQGTLARACPNTDTLAEFVYHIADKMIAEREKAHESI